MPDLANFFPTLSPLQTVFLIIILIPTLWALIWGAPWVPTPKDRVRRMLKLANIKRGDTVYDLGCGDGRLVHLASIEHGARAIGYELSPLVYALAKFEQPLYWIMGSRGKVRFGNFYKADLRDADVIVCYLLTSTMGRVAERFEKELKPGTRIVSYAFPILAWKTVHRAPRIRKKNYGPIWVYEIGKHHPAKAPTKRMEPAPTHGRAAKSTRGKTTQRKRRAKQGATKPTKAARPKN